MTDDSRSIELEVEVPGTPEEVWAAVATGPGIGSWFVPSTVEEHEGGERALHRAVEGAEDNPESAAWELRERGIGPGDAVVAISASGHTPFTLGSLEAAHAAGARTIAITCDPGSPLAEAAEIAITPQVGPEVIAGSTRMKGGLAQKMVLHSLSTAVMVRLGLTEGNLMTNLATNSDKLRQRALRIVMALSRCDEARAAELLAAADGNVSEAVARAKP